MLMSLGLMWQRASEWRVERVREHKAHEGAWVRVSTGGGACRRMSACYDSQKLEAVREGVWELLWDFF